VLSRDNAFSTQYAARVIEHADGERVISYALAAESKHVYRLRRDRDWLTAEEGARLRDLLAAYWALEATPSRFKRALWRSEYACWLQWGDLTISTIVSGLEALLKTERHGATSQFTRRVPSLAAELGVDGVDANLCDRLYDARSEWVHGAHVRLFTSGLEQQERESRVGHDFVPEAFREICRLQDLLRAAVHRCILDGTFMSTFESDDAIRTRWST